MSVHAAPAPIPTPDGAVPPQDLTVVDVPGAGRAAGRAYGEACRDLIRYHHDRVLERLSVQRGFTADEAYAQALPYRDATAAEQPELAAEVDGVAEGAGLPLPAGWVLQLRAELMRPAERARTDECTSFAVVGAASADGGTLAGQNADLPSLYRDLLVLLRRDPPGRPRLATVTPAGQIGYHGMNEAGVAVFANFLHSSGWRVGVPRYLLTRIVLAERSREDAVAAVERTRRASPRNLLIADEDGATDIETTTTSTARLEPREGLLAHSNHYIAASLAEREETTETSLRNSERRLRRMETLLAASRGRHDVVGMASVLRDRDGIPDALCRASGEWPDDVITIASTIAEVRARRLWVTVGPPHLAAYRPYSVAPSA